MICAIDCDLRQSYCVFEDGRSGRGGGPSAALLDAGKGGPRPYTVLFEIASPVSFNRGAAGHAAMTQLAKWAIWNAAQAANLVHLNAAFGIRVLVAPSNVWTKGYDLHTRHAMAKCVQKKKDLRECEAMIFMYRHAPALWKPLPEYLATL